MGILHTLGNIQKNESVICILRKRSYNMTAEIQKIGVNVNQIARRVNATGNVYKEDIEEIKGVLAEIWRLQRLNLLKAR